MRRRPRSIFLIGRGGTHLRSCLLLSLLAIVLYVVLRDIHFDADRFLLWKKNGFYAIVMTVRFPFRGDTTAPHILRCDLSSLMSRSFDNRPLRIPLRDTLPEPIPMGQIVGYGIGSRMRPGRGPNASLKT